MNRRGFLQAILIAGAAPAIVRAGSLMRIMPTGLIPIERIVGWERSDDGVLWIRATPTIGEYGNVVTFPAERALWRYTSPSMLLHPTRRPMLIDARGDALNSWEP